MLGIRLNYIGRSLLDLLGHVTEDEFEVNQYDEWSQYPFYIAFDYRDVELALDMTGNLDSGV